MGLFSHVYPCLTLFFLKNCCFESKYCPFCHLCIFDRVKTDSGYARRVCADLEHGLHCC